MRLIVGYNRASDVPTSYGLSGSHERASTSRDKSTCQKMNIAVRNMTVFMINIAFSFLNDIGIKQQPNYTIIVYYIYSICANLNVHVCTMHTLLAVHC